MPILAEVLDPAIESVTNYLRGQKYNKRPLKTIRGVLDGMCPETKRQVGFRSTPAFRRSKDYFERPVQRALSNNGLPSPTSDEGVYKCVRNTFDVLGQLAKSNGNEVETERQRLRNNLRWVRDFLCNLKPPATANHAEAAN